MNVEGVVETGFKPVSTVVIRHSLFCGSIFSFHPTKMTGYKKSGMLPIPLIPGMLKHTFSVGYSRKWDKWEFGVASQFMISDGEDTGSGKIIGGDFDESSMKAKAYLLFLGMKYRF